MGFILREEILLDMNPILSVLIIVNCYFSAEEFVLRKLTEVNRADLKAIFKDMMSYKTDYIFAQPAAANSKTQRGKSKSHKSKYFNPPKAGRHRQGKAGFQPASINKKNLDEQMDLVLKKVGNIENMMLEARAPCKSTFAADAFQSNIFQQGKKADPRHLFGRYGGPLIS